MSEFRNIGTMQKPSLVASSNVHMPKPKVVFLDVSCCMFFGENPISTWMKMQSQLENIDETKAMAKEVATAHFLYLKRHGM